jgi:hypothetical protein
MRGLSPVKEGCESLGFCRQEMSGTVIFPENDIE